MLAVVLVDIFYIFGLVSFGRQHEGVGMQRLLPPTLQGYKSLIVNTLTQNLNLSSALFGLENCFVA
jgi:hypothetical protein